MSKFLNIAIVSAFTFLLCSPAPGQTVNWGGNFGDVNVQSDGSILTATFTFAIGTFGSLVPSEGNTALWQANWKLIDLATYNEAFSFFTSSVDLPEHDSFPGQIQSNSPAANPATVFGIGEQAYIWIYDTSIPGFGAEWVLITDNDGLGGDDWMLADPGASPGPVDWRVSTATTAVYGGLNGVQGPGEYTSTPPLFNLQTATFVPEPSSALLVVIGLSLLLGRPGRNKRGLA